MLNVILGSPKGSIHYVSEYFNAEYDNSWFNSKIAKDIIKGIDNSEHIKDGYIVTSLWCNITKRPIKWL